MAASGDVLVGVWSGCPYPLMEVELVFCPCGRGLLFFYWGSAGNTPFVDEFIWTHIGEERIKVEWVVRHDVGPCLEWASEDEEDGTDAQIFPWADEVERYTLLEEDGSLGLDISIGMHCSFIRLYYSRPPKDYEQEKQRLQEAAEHFDPFGPGRQLWLVGDDNEWRKLPVEVVENDWEYDKQANSDNPLNLTTLLMIFGIFGQIGYIGEYLQNSISPKLVVPLALVPVLLGLVREDPVLRKWPQSLVYWLRSIAALWYVLLSVTITGGIISGHKPSGWLLYLALMIAGLYPAVQVFLKRRKQ